MGMTISELRAKLQEAEAAGRGAYRVYMFDPMEGYTPFTAGGLRYGEGGTPALVIDLETNGADDEAELEMDVA